MMVLDTAQTMQRVHMCRVLFIIAQLGALMPIPHHCGAGVRVALLFLRSVGNVPVLLVNCHLKAINKAGNKRNTKWEVQRLPDLIKAAVDVTPRLLHHATAIILGRCVWGAGCWWSSEHCRCLIVYSMAQHSLCLSALH